MITYTDYFDAFDITVVRPEKGSNLLLAQVVYGDEKPQSVSVTAYGLRKRSEISRAVQE
jgi:hypothetical protein